MCEIEKLLKTTRDMLETLEELRKNPAELRRLEEWLMTPLPAEAQKRLEEIEQLSKRE
jgi:hypothetical protein